MVVQNFEFKTIALLTGSFDLSPYNLPNYVLSEDGQRFFFYVQPQKYTRSTNGNGYSFLSTGQGRQLKIGLKEINISVEIIRPEANIIYALEAIARNAIVTETPLTLEDTVRPERQDFTSGITSRLGYIFTVRDIQGCIKDLGTQAGVFPAGCGFTFTQSCLDYF